MTGTCFTQGITSAASSRDSRLPRQRWHRVLRHRHRKRLDGVPSCHVDPGRTPGRHQPGERPDQRQRSVPSTTTAGSIFVTFTASTGTAPGSYTLTYCTNAGMTTGCVPVTNYTSGTGDYRLDCRNDLLRRRDGRRPSGVRGGDVQRRLGTATIQLTAPTGVVLSAGTTAARLP